MLGAGQAAATPLCRDLKGLFTPCPDALTRSAQRHLEKRIAALPPPTKTSLALPVDDGTARVASLHASSVHHSRLCRDSKGLYTPCSR